MNRERLIRRTVLKFFADTPGIPQGIEDVREHLAMRLSPVDAEHAQQACAELETSGYLADARPTAADAAMWKVSASGLRMAKRQVKPAELDPMIWES